jgi:hypothetical protein
MRRLRFKLGEMLGGIAVFAATLGLSVPLIHATSSSVGDAVRFRIMAVIWASVIAFTLIVQVAYWGVLTPLLRRRDRDRQS